MKAATVPVTERLGGVRSLSVTVPERKIELFAAELGVATLDPLRFKTSIEIDGVPAYEEDAWSGRNSRDRRCRDPDRRGRAALRADGPRPRHARARPRHAAYVPAGRYLLWSDIPNDRMLRWDETTGSVGVFRQPAGYTSGNTLDLQT